METKKIEIKRGLDIPISDEPAQVISEAKKIPRKVALLGNDYVGMKPQIAVSVGDNVKLGQLLFTDKKRPSIRYTSPAAGTVYSINRGEKRMLLSVVIHIEGDDAVTFNSYSEYELPSLDRKKVVGLLIESGLWTSLRSRPFSTVADPEAIPHSLFITAMDTNPLAPSVAKIIEGKEKHFMNGVTVLSALTEGKVFLCKPPGETIPYHELESLSVVEFSGPHPAGNVGTHIHFLDPVNRNKHVWHIHAQDVVDAGILFTTGKLNIERIISLAGPSVKDPRLIKTRIGASADDITKGELKEGEHRIISGSVLSGHEAHGPTGFLGKYHQQISVIPEGRKREFLGWLSPGMDRYSVKNIVLSRLLPGKKFNFSTSTHGAVRAIVPVESYEKVMPLDIMPTYLLKALAVDDVEEAEKLGCLELDEEDLALCTFVCPSKIDHGTALRRNLMLIEKEG
ncbi:MAG: Na(+)-translocating NADH-quinone reductase subunit A [Nitrospiraceae bacterium]|nr:MAG: Na(+)-translocating NADH-quinone reductase subunit A [Nitrospiraceae bacterium]